MKDIRYGIRMLLKTPGISIVAILTVSLGMGGVINAASGVYGMMLRGLPFEDGDRLMRISQTVFVEGISGQNLTLHDLDDFRTQQTSFEDLAGFYFRTINLADEIERPERYLGTFVEARMFSETNTLPLMGRVLRAEEDAGHRPAVIVISHRVWQNRYRGDPDIIGRSIRANGAPVTIVGVMPEGYRFPFDNDLWMPLGMDLNGLTRGEGERLWVAGRLKRGVPFGQALAQLVGISHNLADDFPVTNAGVGVEMERYDDNFLPDEIRRLTLVSVIGVFGVLLIACANVANLLLARSAVRVKEMAVRSAIGATRGGLIRQLMIEAAVLVIVGGLGGIAFGWWLIGIFGATFETILKPHWIYFQFDLPVFFFAAGAILVTSVVSGIVPALKASGINVHDVLKDESAGSSSFRMGRFSSVLVVTEIALSCGLLVGAGMTIKSVMNLKNLETGFSTANLFTARVALFGSDYPEDEDRVHFFEELTESLQALAGVENAALVDRLPGTGANETRFGVEGKVYMAPQDYPGASYSIITPEFFRTFGVELLEGRQFDISDRAGVLPVAIVNQSFASKFFGRAGVIGKRILLGRSEIDTRWITIVGVVPDLHVGGGVVGGLGSHDAIAEQIYRPLAQAPPHAMRMAVRTSGNSLNVAPQVRDVVAELNPNLPIYEVDSMDGAILTATWMFGHMSRSYSAFGAIALFMAAVGLYGAMAFSVSRRTQEMGIRMALGARDGDVMALVFKKGMVQLGIGITLGLGLGVVISRALASVSVHVDPGDPVVYAAVVVTFVVAGMLACAVPARRATQVDLVDALKAN